MPNIKEFMTDVETGEVVVDDLDTLPKGMAPADTELPDIEVPEEEQTTDELDIEVVDDTPEEDRGRKPLTEKVEDPTPEELEEYSAGVKKRISQLVHARHDERRRADQLAREKAALEQVARALAEENKRYQKLVADGSAEYISKSKTLAERELEAARGKLKYAYDAGDPDAIVAAQEEFNRALNEFNRVSDMKPVKIEETDYTDVLKNVASTQQQAAPQLDDKVVTWAERNPWFHGPTELHQRMTKYAYDVHNELVGKYGQAYTQTDEYYNNIDKAMRGQFPEYFGGNTQGVEEDEQPSRKQKTAVASARRTAPKKVVRLTESEKRIAERLGVPLELYAKHKASMEKR